MSYERTHDEEIYQDENPYQDPKATHKIFRDKILETTDLNKETTVVDFGGARGEFLHLLSEQTSKPEYRVYDVSTDLMKQGKKHSDTVSFYEGSVMDADLLGENTVDISIMIGVHGIFDDFNPCFSNLIRWTKPGGYIFIYGPFNPHPVDVWVQYRDVEEHPPGHRERGWNTVSKKTVKKILSDKNISEDQYEFTHIEYPTDRDPCPDDPAKTWTFEDSEGNRIRKNGLNIIRHNEILEIWPQ